MLPSRSACTPGVGGRIFSDPGLSRSHPRRCRNPYRVASTQRVSTPHPTTAPAPIAVLACVFQLEGTNVFHNPPLLGPRSESKLANLPDRSADSFRSIPLIRPALMPACMCGWLKPREAYRFWGHSFSSDMRLVAVDDGCCRLCAHVNMI